MFRIIYYLGLPIRLVLYIVLFILLSTICLLGFQPNDAKECLSECWDDFVIRRDE